MPDRRRELVRLLRSAHAGELAAARAYAGHWRACSDPGARRRIARIEQEELEHRAILRAHLAALGSCPSALLEAVRGGMGSLLRRLCAWTPEWLLATAAARLERRGAAEYAHASRLAAELGLAAMAAELADLGAVEQAHHAYFAAMADRRTLEAGGAWRSCSRWR